MPNIIRVGGGGGGGLDLTVVGGLERPAEPKNNTLWLKTETEIDDVYLSPSEPPMLRKGKNQIFYQYNDYDEGGETYNEDGSITVVADSSGLSLTLCHIYLPAGTYTLSGAEYSPAASNMSLVVSKYNSVGNPTGDALAVDSGEGATFTLEEATRVVVYASVNPNAGVTFFPQLEVGETATEFEVGQTPTAVWINTSNRYQSDATAIASTTHLLEVKKDPFLLINVLQFNQWDGNYWARRDGGIYANNAWTDMALYIYWYGTQNEDYPIRGTRYSSNATAGTSDQLTYNDEWFALSTSSSYDFGAIYTQAWCSVNAEEFTTVGVRVYSSCASPSTATKKIRIGFSSDVDSENLSNTAATNAQSVELSVAAHSEWEEFSVPIVATGIVRPSIAFGASDKAITVSVAYWVLT